MDNQGSPNIADGIEESFALAYYPRMRFIQELLPSLKSSPLSSARIVSIHTAGKEGKLIEDDLELKQEPNYSVSNAIFHGTTMNTLAMEEVAMCFDRTFEDWYLPLRFLARWIVAPVAMLFTLSVKESGERHLFHATSARYPPGGLVGKPEGGVAMPAGVEVADGSDGKNGSGCHLLNWDGETVGDQKLLEDYRKMEMGKKIWEHTNEVFQRALTKPKS